jgi:hypothetical protein
MRDQKLYGGKSEADITRGRSNVLSSLLFTLLSPFFNLQATFQRVSVKGIRQQEY